MKYLSQYDLHIQELISNKEKLETELEIRQRRLFRWSLGYLSERPKTMRSRTLNIEKKINQLEKEITSVTQNKIEQEKIAEQCFKNIKNVDKERYIILACLHMDIFVKSLSRDEADWISDSIKSHAIKSHINTQPTKSVIKALNDFYVLKTSPSYAKVMEERLRKRESERQTVDYAMLSSYGRR